MYDLNYNYLSSNYFFCPRIARIYTNSNIFNALVTCVKCLEGTTPQDLPLCSLIAFVRFVRPNRSPLNAKHEIRVDFFDIFGCSRHNSNKFGFALACTKIREIRGQKIRGIFLCKVIPPPPHFQQKHPKTTPVFFSLKVVPESAESRFFLLDFHRPAPAVRTPRAQDAVAPRA